MNTERIIKAVSASSLMAVSLVCASCNSGNTCESLLMDVTEVDYLDKSELELEGKEIDIEVFGIDNIMYCDSFLVALTQDPERLFKVYDMRTCTEVVGFGYIGRAKNEFTAPDYMNIQYKRDGKTIIPIDDFRSRIIEMDFTSSVQQGKVVIEQSAPFGFDGTGEGSMSVIDDDLSTLFFASAPSYDYKLDEWSVPTFSIISKDETLQIPVFSKLTEANDESCYTAMYYGTLYKHPTRNLYAYTLGSRDYILYFDLDNDKRFGIHQQGASTFDDIYPKYDYEYGRMTFANSLPTNDFIITNYCGGSFFKEDLANGHYYTELVLFDWDGNYLCGIKIKLNISRCAYDEVNKILYGIDGPQEKVYQFDFSPIVEYINIKNRK